MIPIPRQGIFWGVEDRVPPTGPFLLKINDEILASFQDENQALLSVWFMGFSYKQLLILFPNYKSIHNIRNYIFPTNIEKIIKMKKEFNPRQLVDEEYLNIVRHVEYPQTKLSPIVYSHYYKFMIGEKITPAWIENDSIKMLNKKIDEYKSKIEQLQIELKEYEDLMENFK